MDREHFKHNNTNLNPMVAIQYGHNWFLFSFRPSQVIIWKIRYAVSVMENAFEKIQQLKCLFEITKKQNKYYNILVRLFDVILIFSALTII